MNHPTETLTIEAAREICQRFANQHKVIFNDAGECGFGRPCVGFSHGDNWIAHNPYRHPDYEPIPELACGECRAPEDVNAYHKHDCLAVLGQGDESIIGLAKWVQKLEAAGTVEIVTYNTGAEGLQAVFSGTTGKAVIVRQ